MFPYKNSTTSNASLSPLPLARKHKTMASSFRSFVSSAKSTIQGTPTPEERGTPTVDKLFTKVNKEDDGDDCDHDCASCNVKYPRTFKIDEDDELYGHVKGWSTHILVATGKSDWVRDVADEKGSVMEAIEKKADIKVSNGKLMLSASNIPTPNHDTSYEQPTTVVLLPAFVIIENVHPSNVNTLISSYINIAPTNVTPLSRVSLPSVISASPAPLLPSAEQLTSRPSPHKALILLCSQKTRDARCGTSAPLLRKELERHLRSLGLYRDLDDERPGGVGIYFISHVGGHKYSANVLIYRRPNAFGQDGETEKVETVKVESEKVEGEVGAGQCIWLARIRPEDCEGLVKFTVLKGKVVKPERQLRGGFDRGRGVFSW